MQSPKQNLIYKMKRELGECQTSEKNVKREILTPINRFQKVNYLTLLSSKYYWNFFSHNIHIAPYETKMAKTKLLHMESLLNTQ